MATLKIVNVFCSSESSLHLQGHLTNPSSSNIFSTNHHVSNQFSDRRLRVIADTTIAHRFYHPSSDRRTRLRISEKVIQHSPIRAVPVQVAHELLNAGHRFLDVRTAEEFANGHIEGAINIPYMFKVGSGTTKNLKFLEDVKEMFGSDDEVVVGCEMGKRSQMAVLELVSAGYTGLTDMAGGYLAWVQSGMPTVDV